MKLDNFLEEFKISENPDDIFGVKAFLESLTLRKPKKTKEEIMEDYNNDFIRYEISEQLTNEAMFHELFSELFVDDDRPVLKSYFKGNVTRESFSEDIWFEYTKALIEYLDLENGIEDIISIEYNEKTDLTAVKYYGS